jgi:hypothetical protein
MIMPAPIAFNAVAIDFDGVIHEYSRGWHDGTTYDDPTDGAFDAIRDFMAERRPVVVFTARATWAVAEWFAVHAPDLRLHVDHLCTIEFWEHTDSVLITNRKVVAKHYIDDRAIRHVDWATTRMLLRAAESLDDVGDEAQKMDLT